MARLFSPTHLTSSVTVRMRSPPPSGVTCSAMVELASLGDDSCGNPGRLMWVHDWDSLHAC